MRCGGCVRAGEADRRAMSLQEAMVTLHFQKGAVQSAAKGKGIAGRSRELSEQARIPSFNP